jgi:hypothetical protein
MACTPGDLLNNASCFNCLSQPQLEAIMTYLLCQISGGGTGIVLTAPNGTRWQIKVDNSGNLSTQQVT